MSFAGMMISQEAWIKRAKHCRRWLAMFALLRSLFYYYGFFASFLLMPKVSFYSTGYCFWSPRRSSPGTKCIHRWVSTVTKLACIVDIPEKGLFLLLMNSRVLLFFLYFFFFFSLFSYVCSRLDGCKTWILIRCCIQTGNIHATVSPGDSCIPLYPSTVI